MLFSFFMIFAHFLTILFFTVKFWESFILDIVVIVIVQSLSHVQTFVTSWTAARQSSLSFTISRSLLKLMSIESVMPSNHLIPVTVPFSACPQSLPASGSFPVCQLFASGGQSIETSATASVLPMNIQGWFPLGLTGLISFQCKGLSRVFSSSKASILWHSAFLIIQVSHPYMTPGKTIALIIQTFVGKAMLYFLICSLGWSLFFFQGASIFSFHGCSHKKIKSVIVSIVFPSICHEVMEPDATIFVLWMLSFKPALPLSSILP